MSKADNFIVDCPRCDYIVTCYGKSRKLARHKNDDGEWCAASGAVYTDTPERLPLPMLAPNHLQMPAPDVVGDCINLGDALARKIHCYTPEQRGALFALLIAAVEKYEPMPDVWPEVVGGE